jgi:hypothetical protein
LERIAEKIPPPLDVFVRLVGSTGLQTADHKAKPALTVWDAYLKAKYTGGK